MSLDFNNTQDAYQPLLESRSLNKPFSLLCLMGLLGLSFWLYQLAQMWFWQQDLQHKLKQNNPQQTTATPAPHAPLLISHVTLPNLPSGELISRENKAIATTITPSSQKQPQVQAQHPKPAKPRVIKAVHKTAPVQSKLKQLSKKQADAATKNKNKVKTPVDSQAVMEQLQFSSGLDLQIALPKSAAKRERLLDYLYRCSGAQFAVLQQQQLVYLSPKRYVPTSKWLRVVSGGLSSQETAWLAHHQGQPVRLLPQAVDQRLAKYIANTLQGKPLRSLRAQYTLTASGLALSHINLNQQLIATQWLLQQSQCH